MTLIPKIADLETHGTFLGEAFTLDDERAPTGLRMFMYGEDVYVVKHGFVRYYCPRDEWETRASTRYHYVV